MPISSEAHWTRREQERSVIPLAQLSYGFVDWFVGWLLPFWFPGAAIVIPGQSVAADKDGVAVNQRRQTLKELLTQSMHYSEKVRKGNLQFFNFSIFDSLSSTIWWCRYLCLEIWKFLASRIHYQLLKSILSPCSTVELDSCQKCIEGSNVFLTESVLVGK